MCSSQGTHLVSPSPLPTWLWKPLLLLVRETFPILESEGWFLSTAEVMSMAWLAQVLEGTDHA